MIAIAKSQSRDPDNPTGVRGRTHGRFSQRIEARMPALWSNTITSVEKDNYIIEINDTTGHNRSNEQGLPAPGD